jgi:Family of unknown function (DUF5906)
MNAKTYPRADILMLNNIPRELRDLKQWECWLRHGGKKVPINPHTGSAYPKGIDADAMGTASFNTAVKRLQLDVSLLGPGFRFKTGGEYVGVDFDDCRDPATGAIHPWVEEWLRKFETYADVSPSGTGVKLILKGHLDKAITKTPLGNGVSVEVYSKGRYFALTGVSPNGDAMLQMIPVRQSQLDDLLSEIPTTAPKATEKKSAAEPVAAGEREPWLFKRAVSYRKTGDANEQIYLKLKIDNDVRCGGHVEDSHLRDIAYRLGKYAPVLAADRTAIRALVEELNKTYFVVESLKGKCRIAWEEENPEFLGTRSLVLQTFDDFRNRFMHKLIEVGKKKDGEPLTDTLANVWLESPDRRQYSQVVYEPGAALSKDIHNLWRGFSFEPKKGDCGLYLTHLKDNICQGSECYYDYLIHWLAYAVQHPGEPGHTAVVLKGKEGTGKNVAASGFKRLWGPYAKEISQSTQLTGRFNAHMRACSVLIVNEAFFAGDRSHIGPLKAIITEPRLSIEAKGIDVTETKNLLHVIMLSNEDWVVPAGIDARRFNVLQVGEEHRSDVDYFKRIVDQLESGGYAALLHHLLNEIDLGNFTPRICLSTPELEAQKNLSLDGVDRVWKYCLDSGKLPGTVEKDGTAVLIGSDLIEWAARQPLFKFIGHLSTENIGHLFGNNPRAVRKGMNFTKKQTTTGDQRPRMYVIPPLEEARKRWNAVRTVTDWDVNEDDNEPVWIPARLKEDDAK